VNLSGGQGAPRGERSEDQGFYREAVRKLRDVGRPIGLKSSLRNVEGHAIWLHELTRPPAADLFRRVRRGVEPLWRLPDRISANENFALRRWN